MASKTDLLNELLEAGEMVRRSAEKGDYDNAIKWYNQISKLIEEILPKLKISERKMWENLLSDAKGEIEKIQKHIRQQYCIREIPVKKHEKKFHNINEDKKEHEYDRKEPKIPYTPTNLALIPFVNDVLDMRRRNINLKWDEIANLNKVKFTLQTTILAPIRYKAIIEAKPIYASINGTLLFGPPGTGKTMLAKAVATEGHTAFFECNPSNIISKWRGDSLKIFQCLMEAARYYSPSTIFFDEIDVFCSKRGVDGEAEHSRRLKTEFLTQMDGIKGKNIGILFLGATNFPWNIDDAILRRLQRRCYIPLPNYEARKRMLEIYLKNYPIGKGENINLDIIAKQLDGYSGSDIYTYCRTIARLPVERFLSERINIDPNEPIPLHIAKKIRLEYLSYGNNEKSINEKIPLLKIDFIKGIKLVKKSVNLKDIKTYEKWDLKYGAYTDERLKYIQDEETTSSDDISDDDTIFPK